MKRILVFVNTFAVGGVTNVVKQMYYGIDKTKYKVDFVRLNKDINEFDKEVIERGGKIYYYENCPLNKIPYFNYKIQQLAIAKQILKQIKGVKYDAIHVHANVIIGLYVGIKAKIPVRIAHFHEATPDFGDNVNKSWITRLIWKNRQKCYNKWATVKAGDSLKACKIKYGEKVAQDEKLCVLYPPIDMQKFNPNNYDEGEIVNRYFIDINCFNIIHVGRFTPVKNQKFIIEVLKEIDKIKKAKLYLVGEGEYKNQLVDYAKELDVLDKIVFLPANTSPAIYKVMNCSILPSFSEAFGMVAVESQLMGVPCFASNNVPSDVDVGACEFLDLNQSAKEWAKEIVSYDYDNVIIDEDKKTQFSIESLIKKVEEIYC